MAVYAGTRSNKSRSGDAQIPVLNKPTSKVGKFNYAKL